MVWWLAYRERTEVIILFRRNRLFQCEEFVCRTPARLRQLVVELETLGVQVGLCAQECSVAHVQAVGHRRRWSIRALA